MDREITRAFNDINSALTTLESEIEDRDNLIATLKTEIASLESMLEERDDYISDIKEKLAHVKLEGLGSTP
jgi:chromosome segregation ATPase